MDIKTEKKLFTIPLKLPFTLNDFIESHWRVSSGFQV